MRTGESTEGRMVLDLGEINPSSPIFPRLWLYPQMVIDPIHGHPSWAVVLVAVSVGECTDRLGPGRRCWNRNPGSLPRSGMEPILVEVC